MVLILDNIRSMYNVGSIFRTSDGFGVEHLYLCGLTPVPPRQEISKTALGAEEVVPFTYFENTSDAIKHLRDLGFSIIALEKNDRSEDISKINWPKKTALILGHEISGILEEILKEADSIVHIPMEGIKESYNVASATAIAIYSNYINKNKKYSGDQTMD